MATFIALNVNGEIQERDCTTADAASIVMSYDGHEWDIRPLDDGEGFALWASQFSRNSTAGGKPLVKSVIYSLKTDRAEAEADIFQQVCDHADWWKGCDVRDQAEYDADMARLAAEEAGA